MLRVNEIVFQKNLFCSENGTEAAVRLGAGPAFRALDAGWYDEIVPANIELAELHRLTPRKDSKLASLDEQVLEKQVRICKAFANSTRLQLLDLLGQREWPVSELQEQLSISKPNLSQHLAILKAAGVVSARREGKQVYCSLAFPEVKSACRLIRDVLRAQIRQGRRLAV